MDYDVILVDASNFAYKGWWPVKTAKTSEGVHSGLEFGFIKNLLTLVRERYPAQIILVWDGAPVRCKSLFAGYKEKRESNHSDESSWIDRLKVLREVFKSCVVCLWHPEKEADELIAQYVHHHPDQKILIQSNDQDMYQLISDNVHSNTGKTGIYNRASVEERWGVPPEKAVLYRAIRGDSSDDIPGVKRIPKDVVARFANQARDLDHMLQLIDDAADLRGKQKEKLQEGKELIRRNFKLMSLAAETDVPTQVGEVTKDIKPAYALCVQLEMKSLLERLEWRLLSGEK